jgi:hypothetical protein
VKELAETVDHSSVPDLDGQRHSMRSEGTLIAVTICFGLVHTWAGRYSMSPDGISYLDVGSAFFRHDWFGAFNAYWSPLYSWVQGVAMGVLKPSPRWEFPVGHVVNFGVLLVALAAFRFLLQSCLLYRRWRGLQVAGEQEYLPDWVVTLFAYPIFWWASFELMPLYEIGPDQALSACLYAASGLLLCARSTSHRRDFLLFGFVLGVGYWVKAPFFIVALVFLALAYLWGRRSAGWASGVALAFVVFVVTSSPLIVALSMQKHRLTFGDSGRLNYAWFISPQTFHRNWQGEEPGSGTPAHPTREVLRVPPVYTFQGPVVGSYPPWLDPSYWNEGLRPGFSLKSQIQALLSNGMTEISLVLRAEPALLAGVITLAAMSGSAWFAGIRELWLLLVISLSAFAMYIPVHVEPRFLGGFLLLLFLVPIVVVRLRKNERRAGRYVVVAVFAVMSLGTVDTAFRFATLHLAVPGNGPSPSFEHVIVANQVRQIGMLPGDKVAIIGDGTGAYWARLAKLTIIAEVMSGDHGAQLFWRSSDSVQSDVLRVFAASGAKMVVTDSPPRAPGAEWIPIKNTSWYMLPLRGDAVRRPF